MTPRISVQRGDFDPGAEIARLAAAGAIASFCGNVRGDGDVVALELEHYPAMTGAALERTAGQAAERWPLLGLTVIHRVGRLATGEHIVFVGAASDHREAALAATHFVIDRLKTDAPFWKREHCDDGSARWVEARSEDDAARDRWNAATGCRHMEKGRRDATPSRW